MGGSSLIRRSVIPSGCWSGRPRSGGNSSKVLLLFYIGSGPAPEERKYHIAEIMFPYFLVFAGEASTDLDDLWIYNFLTLSWTEVHPEGQKPKARRFHSSVLLNNCLYITGGCYNKYDPLNDMWAMDLTPLE